jgi:Golgi phosphoprotein 3 GPP34
MKLTEQAYLIAWDKDRGRIRGNGEHPAMVAAALLIQLHQDGALTDDGKHPVAHGDARDEVVQRIAASRPRSWRHWVSATRKPVYAAVRAGLERERIIAVEERSLLGLPLPPRVTVRDPRVVGTLVQRCRSAALGSAPTGHVPADDAALAALVGAAQLGQVLTWRERRQAKKRIAAFTERSGPAAKAFKKLAEGNRAAAAS